MKAWHFLKAAVAEAISLVVDDKLTFLGAAVALAITYPLAHHVHALRHAAGYLLFAIVWVTMSVSMFRERRTRRQPG